MYGELISSVTVGAGGASSIDFTSIPGTYTDLVVVLSARSNYAGAGDDIWIKVNNLATGIYSWKAMGGDGSSTAYNQSYTNETISYAGWVAANGATSNTFGNMNLYIPNYGGSTNKSWSSDSVGENNATNSRQYLHAGLIATTSAITTLSFKPGNGSAFVQYSTAYLYGLTKGSGGATVS